MNTPPPDSSPPVPPSIPPIPADPPNPPIPPNPPVIPPVPAATESGAREAADKALKITQEGVAAYKRLNQPTQIYLGGLAVTVLFSLLFDVITMQVEMANVPGNLTGLLSQNHGTVSAFGSGTTGKFAVLAAAAGIGIWVWNLKSAIKEAWVPKALAGCAGFSALMYLVLMLTSNGSRMGVVEVDVDMTLFGFWIPFAGAIAATVVSVKKLKSGSSV